MPSAAIKPSTADMINADRAPAARPAEAPALEGILHILTCGSVDDGKSTLIGRLLWDAADLPDDTRATIERSIGPDGLPDLSLLVDGLSAEREQGITIDIAWRYFDAGRRRYVIIDSPGHEQFTRNMATGATHADLAIMLIDARHGVKKQTRRHAAILALMGVRRVVLAINKMDLVGWSEQRFRELDRDFHVVADRFGFDEAIAIPLAARPGDNVVHASRNMPWYDGPTLIAHLARVPHRATVADGPFRLPVQYVVRDGAGFRGLAGTVQSGSVRPGDAVADVVSGARSTIRSIATMDGPREVARQGDAVVLECDDDIDISRGAVLADPISLPGRARWLRARMIWLADTALDSDHGLLLRAGTTVAAVASIDVRSRLDLETLAEVEATICRPNDVLVAEIELAVPAALDRFAARTGLGNFILVDALSGATLAGGIVEDYRDEPASPASRARRAITLSNAALSLDLCRGLAPADAEFRRRAAAVAALMKSVGIKIELEDVEDGSSRYCAQIE